MMKSYKLLLPIIAIFLILACVGSVNAVDTQTGTVQKNINLNSSSEGPSATTTNIYVDVNTGNDAWDGSSSVHTAGTVIGPKQHISKGITSSFSGGNLYIANGTYKEWGLTVDRNLNIYGTDINKTIVDAQGNGIVFKINANIKVNIQHLSMTNGWGSGTVSNEDGDNGGGVYNLGTLTLTDCNIYNNHAGNGQDGTAGHGAGKGGNGGGVYNSGTLTIIDCDIHNNFSGNGGDASATRHGDHGGFGAGIFNNGTLTIQDSWIHDNTAGNAGSHSGVYSGSYGGYGGGICNTNILTMTNCEIYNNKAGNGASNVVEANAQNGGHGGGMYNTGTAKLNDINMHDNMAGTGGTVVNVDGHGGEGGYGGAIYNTGNLTITGTDTQIKNNTAGTGGTSNVTDESAGAGGKAGAIYNAGTCQITDATISNNKGGAGGNPDTLNSNGGGGGSGGAFYNQASATLTLTKCTVSNNQAGNGHSGVTNDKYLNFGGGEGGDGGSGGAIYNLGTTNINTCTISSNKAGNGGTGGQSTLMYNARIGGRGGDGGAIYNGNASILTITGSTVISSNSAGNGGKGGLGRCIFDADLNQLYYNPGNGGNGGNGGGIFNSGTINPLININIQNNTAGAGGAGGVYEVDNTLYDPGEKTPAIPGIGGNGGGIYNAGILNTLENVTMTGNAAGTGGAGSPCSDSEPENGNTGGNGGAIYILDQPMNINNCTISDNHAGDGGAGSDMYVGQNMDSAARIPGKGGTGGSGGAIYILNINVLVLHVNITNTTFDNNNAGNGGAAGRWSSGNPPIGVGGNGNNGGAIGIHSTSSYRLILQIYGSTFTNNKAGLGFIAPQGDNGADGVGGAFYSNINQNFVVNFNRIVDNTPQAVYLNLIAGDSSINFQNNWWGINNYNNELLLQFMGPHVSPMNYTPYLILRINANPTVLNNTLNSNITADLIMNNVGQNTLSMYGKYVPNNITVLFASNWGTMNPQNNVTLNGSSNSIFTATISGNGKVCATVDHQTVCTPIQISDLILQKTGQYVPYCSEIMWKIYAQNLGNTDLKNLVVQDLITPASLTEYWTYYVSYTGGKTWVTDGTYDPTTGNWTINNLPAGLTYILAIYATPLSGNGKTYSNTATCNYNGNQIKADGTIHIIDNIVNMTKNGTYSNNQLIWTIGVVNNGSDSANFSVWDLMGSDCPNTEYLNYHVSYNNGATWVKDGTYDPVNGQWIITGLDKGETFLLRIYSKQLNGTGTYNNTARNSFGENEGASVYIPQASLSLSAILKSAVYLNENFKADIQMENKGPDVAQNVIINIPIPLALQFIDAGLDQGSWSYDNSTRILTLNLGDVKVGDLHLYLTLKPTKLGQYILNHRFTTVTYDPNMNKDTELLTITIKESEDQNPNPDETDDQNTNPNETVNGQTIPMQKTGAPLAAVILAIFAILGGSAYHRLR